jgi:ABC-type sugar transport system substrate-binding protein
MRYLLIFLFTTILLDAKEYLVGFAQDTLANDWRAAQVQEVKDEIAKHPNLKLIVKDAQGKVANQIRDIEEFINMGVDFLITSPKDATVTSLVLKKAIEKDIKVILISRTINSDHYTAFVAPDNHQIGKDAANFLLKSMNYKGTVLMLQGVQGASSTKQREEGFMEIASKYPKIEVIKKRANYLRNDAIKALEEIYRDNIQFDGIYSHSDSMLIGAREVMKRYKGEVASIPMVGIDYIKATQEAILKDEQLASFVYPTSGKEGVQLIVDIIDGKSVPKNSIVATQIVTKENVRKVKPIF